MKLAGKVAIVTGAGQGFGKAISLRLSEEGAKVCAVDINSPAARATAREIRGKGLTAIAIGADVSSEKKTLRMAEETVRQLGRIDILVNNAAIFYGLTNKPFYEIQPREWDRIMAVNVKGIWLCTRAVFPQMKIQGSGKVINFASGAVFSGQPFLAHYVTSKGAVIALTRVLARELGSYGINVNAIAPGFTMTEAGKLLASEEEAKQRARSRCIPRVEQPEDILGAIVFLCSADSDFIAGQTIAVDGGGTMH